LFDNKNVFFAPALPLEDVQDPTGAGDTFAGGFMGYLASTDDVNFENLKRAIIKGSAMASLCVEKFGTEMLQDLTDAQVNDRSKEFVNLSRVDLN
jgi:sugar/nucleoside kinase (ribokinase family)